MLDGNNSLVKDIEKLKNKFANLIGALPPGVATNGKVVRPVNFIPLGLITPTKESIIQDKVSTKIKEYRFYDWTGQRIEKRTGIDNKASNLEFLNTESRFELSKDLPKKIDDLDKSPYSSRDIYSLFSDKNTDYFRYGIQTLNSQNQVIPSEYWNSNENQGFRLSNFKETPWEIQDPVMFGFEIIIDAANSPLLNGSVDAFLNNYSSISEIDSKKAVYNDFKQQFQKFFRTNGEIGIEGDKVVFSKSYPNEATTEASRQIYEPGKKSYLGFYLKSIKGLDKLVESNTSASKKFLVDYGKDVISLEFLEDVSLSIGTLAHLYKLLYWSKPNGKSLIPENLLRFNCEIIISECRNFQRVRKAIKSGNLEILKDNMSRYIYSLRECQFYFDKMSHDADLDIGSNGPKTFDSYTVNFDYKYSSVKMERFLPVSGTDGSTTGWGKYVGYDGGAIWKTGNGRVQNPADLVSKPKFFVVGPKIPGNGIDSPTLIKYYKLSNSPTETPAATGEKGPDVSPEEKTKLSTKDALKNLKKNVLKSASKKAEEVKDNLIEKAVRQASYAAYQVVGNIRVALLQKTLEAIKNATGINPLGLGNVYKGGTGRLANVTSHFDIRGALGGKPSQNSTQNFGKIRQKILENTLNLIKNAPKMRPSNIYLNDGDRSNNSYVKHSPKNPLYTEPKNVNTNARGSKSYFDIRGQVINFLGNNLGNNL